MRSAWDTAWANTSPEGDRQIISERVEQIIDCFGLSYIEPSSTIYFTQLYLNNPTITREEVKAAIQAQESTGKSVKKQQLVFLYRHLPRRKDIEAATGLKSSEYAYKMLVAINLMDRMGRGRKKMHIERNEEIVRLSSDGLLIRDIATRIGISSKTVSRVLHRRRDEIVSNTREIKQDDMQRNKAIVYLINHRDSLADVAYLFGLSVDQVYKIFIRYRDRETTSREAKAQRNTVIVYLKNQGVSSIAIASLFGIASTFVNTIYSSNKDNVTAPHANEETKQRNDVIVQLHIQGVSPVAIASRIGLSRRQVYRVLSNRRDKITTLQETKAQRNTVIIYLKNQGVSSIAIASLVGLSQKQVNQVLSDNRDNVTAPHASEETKQRNDIIVYLRNQRVPPVDIAPHFRMKPKAVQQVLFLNRDRVNTPPLNIGRRQNPENAQRNGAVVYLRNHGTSYADIVTLLGISLELAYNIFSHNKDKITTQREIKKQRNGTVVYLSNRGVSPADIAGLVELSKRRVLQILSDNRDKVTK
jgi:transposase